MQARTVFAALFVVHLFFAIPAAAENAPPFQSGIDDKTGDFVPLDLVLVDEKGDSVALGSLIDRPTVVALVYYSCPSVCRPLLDEVTRVLTKLQSLKMTPGDDYRVLTISFDERDTPEASAKLKKELLQELPKGFPGAAWTFLTGDAESIRRFTESVGFRFRRQGKDFAHPTTLVVVTANGKISRYLYGAEYLPMDLKMAIYEASEGRTGPTIARFLRYCFSYDPKGRKYVLNLTRIVGTVMILTLVGFALFLTAAGKRRAKEQER